MYARLCRKIMEKISPKVQDEGIKNNEGEPITGRQLFKKYLLHRCQEDFEYYAAQKSKRRGLIEFIGELFKLRMLPETFMHECVKKLMGTMDHLKEGEIESLCEFLTTFVGILDIQRARAYMDLYFLRVKELSKSAHVATRLNFMLRVRIRCSDPTDLMDDSTECY